MLKYHGSTDALGYTENRFSGHFSEALFSTPDSFHMPQTELSL